MGDIEQGSKPRSVKIGDDERLGWSSERPRRESGPPRPVDISTRNRVLRPSEELMYSPGSLVVVASSAPAEADAFVNRLVQQKGAVFSMNKVRGLLEIIADIVEMPQLMKSLALLQFFTWFGLFAFWVYAVPAVVDRDRSLGGHGYDSSADRVGLLFASFDATALLVAFMLPWAIQRAGAARCHSLCLAIGAGGLFLFASGTSQIASWAASIVHAVTRPEHRRRCTPFPPAP